MSSSALAVVVNHFADAVEDAGVVWGTFVFTAVAAVAAARGIPLDLQVKAIAF